MRASLSKTVPKKATNITLSLEVYNEAKSLGINLSQTCERLLQDAIRIEREKRWANEHAAFIAAYNQTVVEDMLAVVEVGIVAVALVSIVVQASHLLEQE